MISATITPKAAANFKKLVSEYQKKLGKTKNELMIDLAKSQARALASAIQPYGMSAKSGKKFEESIKLQVSRAIRNSNIVGGSQSAVEAHQSRRNAQGRVPKSYTIRGQFKRTPIPISEALDLAKKKSKNAGLAKAGWIAAAETLDNKKISGIPKWLREDVSHGSSKVTKTGASIVIFLTNQITYISSVLSEAKSNKALSVAYNKNLKRMQSALNKVK